jgi:hypothetical protein
MLGIHERLRAKSETRVKVSAAAKHVWPKIVTEARAGGIDHLQKVTGELRPKFDKITEYNHQQLEEVDIPLYRQMVDLFITKMHLAEPSTRKYLSALVQFVDLWERSLGGSLPREVAELVHADEGNLAPFYADLMSNFEQLRIILKE